MRSVGETTLTRSNAPVAVRSIVEDLSRIADTLGHVRRELATVDSDENLLRMQVCNFVSL